MKIFGLVLIVVSSAICGINYAGTKRDRLYELRSFIVMLELMRAELSTYLCPLPELVEKIHSKVEGRASVFMKILDLNLAVLGEKDFYTIWSESLEISCGQLLEDEQKSLTKLGSILGKFDLELQKESIDECVLLFHESERKESMEFPQLRRLSIGVSMSAGALLAILLV